MCLRTCIQRQLCVYVSSVARLCIQRAVLCIISSWLNPNLKMLKSASGAPGPKSALKWSKSTTFTTAILQVFNLHKIAINPIGDPSVLLIQYLSESSRGISVLPLPRPIYRWDQAQVGKSSASEIGVLWVALRDIFWNLRCHHRGMKVQEIVTSWYNTIPAIVFWDQKVLSEVPNQWLLLRRFCSCSTCRKPAWMQQGMLLFYWFHVHEPILEFPFYRSHVRYTDETGGICVYVRLPRLVVYFARFTHSEPSILHPGASSIWHETSYCIQASSSSIQSFASSIYFKKHPACANQAWYIQKPAAFCIKHFTCRSMEHSASSILLQEAFSI